MAEHPVDMSLMATQEPLTEWAKEPSVQKLKEDFEIAVPGHDKQVAKIREWLDLRNVEGKAKPKTGTNRSQVQPKLIRRQAEWRYSALSEPFLSAERLYKVSPKTWEDLQNAEQNAQVLEWQFQTKLNRVAFVDEYVRTTVDEGTCVVRVGWERETRIVEKEVPIWAFEQSKDPHVIAQLNQVLQLKHQNPNGFLDIPEALQEAAHYAEETGIPVVAYVDGTEIVQDEEVLVNQPTLEFVNFENIYIDPSAGNDLDKANFVIISFETSKAELLKDGRYRNLDKVMWSDNGPLTDGNHASNPNVEEAPAFKDDLRKRVIAYEYWGWYDVHGDNTLVPIVATWVGNTMIRMEENPFPDKKAPLVLVPYLPVKGSTHGEPDAELLEENQAILGAVTRGMIDLMGRSANGQTGFAKGFLDPVNRRKYESGLDYEYNMNQQPNAAIHHHKYPEIPASALNMLALQNQEAEALSGVKAFSGGLSGDAFGDVAAGIRGMLDASSKREMAILRRLAGGFIKLGQKILTMNQIFLSEEEVVRVTNEQFVKIRREDLQGQFDLEVDITTAEVNESQARDLSFLLQTMGNNISFDVSQMILSKIAELKRMPALAKKIEEFRPEPDPMDVQLKELEMQKLQAEIAELNSKRILNEAKARSELSEADLKDLDFVEQETGTKHMRKLDELSQQAESNQQLEITKALLNPNQNGPDIDQGDAMRFAINHPTFRDPLTQ